MKLQIYEKKHILGHQDLGLYRGDIKITLPTMETEPHIDWEGAPIDRATFRQALAFLKWTHDQHKCEGQARFWYNDQTHEWRTVVLPQEKHGPSHTREVEADGEIKTEVITKLMEEGFGEAGTIHHHSNMGAFQSGGDLADELSRSGIHVTVGTMSAKIADFHARMTFKGVNYEAEKEMMRVGQWLPGLRTKRLGIIHKAFNPDLVKFWLSLEDLPKFPEVWKSYVVEAAPTPKSWNTKYPGYGLGFNRKETIGERNKRKHRGEPITYKSRNLTLWLIKPDPQFRLSVRLPKAQQEEIKMLPQGAPDTIEPLTSAELRKINTMNSSEFTQYLKVLRDENRVDCSQIRDEVEEKLSDELSQFRDEFVSDQISETGLIEMFDKLQQTSTRVVRLLEGSSKSLKDSTAPNASDFRDLQSVWIHRLLELMYDLHEEEWLELAEASKASDIDFYKLMCSGLATGTLYGNIEDIYEIDGTVEEMLRADPHVDAAKLLQDIRR